MRDTDSHLYTIRWVLPVVTVAVLGGLGAVFLLGRVTPGDRTGVTAPMVFRPAAASSAPAPPERNARIPDALREAPPSGQYVPDSPFVEVARRVIPAVVSVEGLRTIEHPPIDGENEDLMGRLFPRRGNGDNQIEVPSSGSGFVIDREGFILTNDHVVSGAERVVVHLADGRTYDAVLLGADPGTDVAVLKIEPAAEDAALPVLPLGNSEDIRVGDWAIAVGNPLGELESTLTIGVISATSRRNLRIAGGGPTYQDFVQTDASINFGNSGGPLVNVRGEVWGINSAVNPTGQGLGFAIPINMAREVAVELIRTGTVRRGFLGIFPETLTTEYKQAHGVDPGLAGILVATVQSDSPAERGGLVPGDVITEFNRMAVRDVPEFRKLVADAGVGTQVDLRVSRDGSLVSLSVTLELRPDTPEPPDAWEPPSAEEWLGFQAEDIGAEHVQRYHLERAAGVVLTRIDLGQGADRAGLRVGDVILRAGDRDVSTVEALREALRERAREDGSITLELERGEARLVAELHPTP